MPAATRGTYGHSSCRGSARSARVCCSCYYNTALYLSLQTTRVFVAAHHQQAASTSTTIPVACHHRRPARRRCRRSKSLPSPFPSLPMSVAETLPPGRRRPWLLCLTLPEFMNRMPTGLEKCPSTIANICHRSFHCSAATRPHLHDPKWRKPQILKHNIANNAEPGTCSTQGKRTCPSWPQQSSSSAYGLTR